MAALLFTARSLNYTADATRATRDQIDLAAQGQVAERFSQAIDQLGQTGPDKLSIRLGGIYSLERLMRDSPDDEPTVIEVLCAFVRTSARKPATPVGPTKLPVAPEDVRAAITVLARRPNPDQEQNSRLDFTGTQLSLLGISLPGTDLAGMEMILGYLRDANLRGANLTGANVRGTDLRDADLRGANLRDANLRYTDFSGADLNGVVGLNSEMLQCSYVNDQTRLPPGVVRPPDVPVSERPSC